jgi:hypothetical protein
MWIRTIKKQFLDAASIKCVGLDCEFTSPHEGRSNHCDAVLQLLVASEVLVFQICWANRVPQLLKEFLKDTTIRFCACWVRTKLKFRLRMISKRLSRTPPRIQLWVSMICPMLLLGKSWEEEEDQEGQEDGRWGRRKRRRTNIWLGQTSIELRASVVCRSRRSKRRRTNIWLGQTSIELRASVVCRSRRSLIHCKCIYNFLCSMIILHQLLYVLFTLRGIFYAFSGTNLLTRCHSVNSCFLLFLYFRKVIQEIFSELDETKAKIHILLTRRRSPKERWRRARRRPHHRVAWPHPWQR